MAINMITQRGIIRVESRNGNIGINRFDIVDNYFIGLRRSRFSISLSLCWLIYGICGFVGGFSQRLVNRLSSNGREQVIVFNNIQNRRFKLSDRFGFGLGLGLSVMFPDTILGLKELTFLFIRT